MVPLGGVSALVILIYRSDAVAHRLRWHVSAFGNGNVDVVSYAKTGEVAVSSAVTKPCVNVGARDLACEDRRERTPTVCVDDVLAVVFLPQRPVEGHVGLVLVAGLGEGQHAGAAGAGSPDRLGNGDFSDPGG